MSTFKKVEVQKPPITDIVAEVEHYGDGTIRAKVWKKVDYESNYGRDTKALAKEVFAPVPKFLWWVAPPQERALAWVQERKEFFSKKFYGQTVLRTEKL